jgi:hypothetical protein
MSAVPYRSTAKMVPGDAWLGEMPAAWMTAVMSPSVVAVSTRAWIDGREAMSTVVVVTLKPALRNPSAAVSALAMCKSASTTCLPALTLWAMAWPIDPAPMTTMTSLMTSFSLRCCRRLVARAGW